MRHLADADFNHPLERATSKEDDTIADDKTAEDRNTFGWHTERPNSPLRYKQSARSETVFYHDDNHDHNSTKNTLETARPATSHAHHHLTCKHHDDIEMA